MSDRPIEERTLAVEEALLEETEEQEQKSRIDFKLVSFSLGGKDYGIDIMRVKEISKETRFTFVPNTPPYVRGVHNLRGDIIPVIDLRRLFYLPTQTLGEGEPEDMIILRLTDQMVLGVIVDRIDKVLGVDSQTIKPPHPLFPDINVKYIKGVVAQEERLYILLDVDRIFSAKEAAEEEAATQEQVEEAPPEAPAGDPGFAFVVDTLRTFASFHCSELNEAWVRERFGEWQARRRSEGKEVQLAAQEEAEEFLGTFFSPYTGSLWGDDYSGNLAGLLGEEGRKSFLAWNPGCGKGLESYSVAALAALRFPGARLRVWANDNDLLSISEAPGLSFTAEEAPSGLQEAGLLRAQERGLVFVEAIRDAVSFEYHDIRHRNEYPDVDLVVARDVLSFLDAATQKRLLQEFRDHLKPEGLLLIGLHERIPEEGWTRLDAGNVVAYRKERA